MARPIKDGVLYFPKDTDFYYDDKIRILRAEFGAKGMYLLDYLLCDLYGKNGYFMKWDKNKCLLVSDGASCGCSPEFVSEFVHRCVACSFFDERVFLVFGVLTSAGIQRRYIRMFNSREKVHINKEYWLLDKTNPSDVPTGILSKIAFQSVSGTENPFKNTENPDKSTGNEQKKNKGKDAIASQKKEKEKVSVPEEIRSSFQAYCEMRKSLKKPLTETGIRLALKNLEELAPGDYEKQNRILDQSVFRSWQGLFPLKTADPPKETSPGRQKKKTKIDKEAVEQLEEAILYGMGEDHP